jgi:hypothetical protein
MSACPGSGESGCRPGLPDESGVPGRALTSAEGLPDKSGVPGRVSVSAGELPDKSSMPE